MHLVKYLIIAIFILSGCQQRHPPNLLMQNCKYGYYTQHGEIKGGKTNNLSPENEALVIDSYYLDTIPPVLSEMKNLKAISMNNTWRITAFDLVRVIPNLDSVVFLDMSSCSVSDEEFDLILLSFKNLNCLLLDGNKITRVKHKEAFKRIKVVSLLFNPVCYDSNETYDNMNCQTYG